MKSITCRFHLFYFRFVFILFCVSFIIQLCTYICTIDKEKCRRKPCLGDNRNGVYMYKSTLYTSTVKPKANIFDENLLTKYTHKPTPGVHTKTRKTSHQTLQNKNKSVCDIGKNEALILPVCVICADCCSTVETQRQCQRIKGAHNTAGSW